jgi:hypothetical protein
MIERMNPSLEKQTPAFTRLELLACLAAVTVLTTIIVPALANSGSRSDRVVCFSNLRQMGVAYGQFGLEHDDRPPWRVPRSEGGNADHPLKNNIDVQFSAVSNGLATPKVLTDPGDQRGGLAAANNWGTGRGGLLNPALGRNSISYFLGLDGSFRVPTSILAGDRNVNAETGLGCSSGIIPASRIVTPNPWTNDVHGLVGNIVLFDGSAAQVDSGGLENALKNSRSGDVLDTPPRGHILVP